MIERKSRSWWTKLRASSVAIVAAIVASAGVSATVNGQSLPGGGWGGGFGGGYACPDVWAPVCGVDGKTYSNSCYASLAGVEVAYNGPCGGGPGGPVPIGMIPGGGIIIPWCLCPWGEYCYTPPGQCDADPICMPRPDACLDVWDPVCGCNNVTYSNACYAAMAGVGVQYFDACGGGVMMSTSPNELPDLNRDGIVDVLDLLIVIDSMGPCEGCDADLTGTGEIDGVDVFMVLSAWGMSTVQ